MKVTIIGNGFDLRHGLKTSYKDFFDFYRLNMDKYNLIYQYMISNKQNNSWIDLENDLLTMLEDLSDLKNNLSFRERNNKYVVDKKEYNKTLNRIKLYDAIEEMKYPFFGFDDHNGSLEVNNANWYEKLVNMVMKDYSTIKQGLISYLDYVENDNRTQNLRLESSEIEVLKNSDKVYSFNYTSTPKKYFSGNVNYVHGSLNEDIILGIPFSKRMDIKELHHIFKIPQSIKMNKNSIIFDNYREKLEMFFIGFSFGQSDHYFFQEVKDWITKYTENDYTKMPPIYFNFYYHNEQAILDYLYNLRVFLGEEMLIRFDTSKRIKFVKYD